MVSFVPPVTLEILNCLVASEHLSLQELFDLRLLCAQIKQWLTSNLPKYLQHRLTGSGSASAADQVSLQGLAVLLAASLSLLIVLHRRGPLGSLPVSLRISSFSLQA